jgi:hypothetical protein
MPLFENLAQFGILGTLLAIALLWIKRLQDRIEELHEARVTEAKAYGERVSQDAKDYGERALVISERVHETTSRLADLLEVVRER